MLSYYLQLKINLRSDIIDSMRDSTWTGYLLTALAPAIWGSTYIVATELLPPDRPFTTALVRTLPAGILLTLWARRMPARGQWTRLATLGTLNIGVFQALLFIAAYRLPGGLAAVVGAIQPLLVAGLAWLYDGRRPPALATAACLLGVGGMAALLLSPGAVWDSLGIAAALGGAACMAVGTFLAQRWRTEVPVLAFTGWQLLVGGVLLLPVAWTIDPPLPPLNGTQLLAYGYLVLIGTMAAYVLWFRGLERLSPVAVSSLGLLSPLTAVILGWSLLGQAMTGLSLAGLVTVFACIVAVQWAMSHPQSKTKAHFS